MKVRLHLGDAIYKDGEVNTFLEHPKPPQFCILTESALRELIRERSIDMFPGGALKFMDMTVCTIHGSYGKEVEVYVR